MEYATNEKPNVVVVDVKDLPSSNATKPEALLDYINTGLITSLFFYFAMWWISKNVTTKRMRSNAWMTFTLILFVVSSFSLLAWEWLIILIGSRIKVDKFSAEKLGYITGSLSITVASTRINLIEVANVFLAMVQILSVSIVFFFIASWTPLASPDADSLSAPGGDRRPSTDIQRLMSNVSIRSFSKYYGIIRTVIVAAFFYYQRFINPDTAIFAKSVSTSIELTICAFFLALLEVIYRNTIMNDNPSLSERCCGVNILVVALLVDTFFNHMVNVISAPVAFGNMAKYVFEKVGYMARLVEYVVLLVILCPQTSHRYPHVEADEHAVHDTSAETEQGPLVGSSG